MTTTAEHLCQWLAMVTNHGTAPSGEQLLAPELFEEAQCSQSGTDGATPPWHGSGEGMEHYENINSEIIALTEGNTP